MAKPGFIDIGVSSQFNRSARRNIQDSETSNETRQSVRNNQVTSLKGSSKPIPPVIT